LYGSVRTEEEAGWVHQKEIGALESGGLNHAEDVRGVSAGHATEMFVVKAPLSFKKLAMLLFGTLKSPKL
jgi:hypothetical protein